MEMNRKPLWFSIPSDLNIRSAHPSWQIHFRDHSIDELGLSQRLEGHYGVTLEILLRQGAEIIIFEYQAHRNAVRISGFVHRIIWRDEGAKAADSLLLSSKVGRRRSLSCWSHLGQCVRIAFLRDLRGKCQHGFILMIINETWELWLT